MLFDSMGNNKGITLDSQYIELAVPLYMGILIYKYICISVSEDGLKRLTNNRKASMSYDNLVLFVRYVFADTKLDLKTSVFDNIHPSPTLIKPVA